MENNKLQILDKNLPLRNYPEQDLNRAILMEFMPYLTRLLSLTDETSSNRLEMALPAIKEHCWGMGFSEMKKMFEMYVDNKLTVQPMANYFDRILLGKIVSSYMQQKSKVIKKEILKIMSESEKIEIMEIAIKEAIDVYRETGDIDLSSSKYDYLYAKGLLQGSLSKEDFNDLKRLKYESVKNRLIAVYSEMKFNSLEEKKENKNILKEIQEKVSGTVVYQCKFEMLEDYFKTKL